MQQKDAKVREKTDWDREAVGRNEERSSWVEVVVGDGGVWE